MGNLTQVEIQIIKQFILKAGVTVLSIAALVVGASSPAAAETENDAKVDTTVEVRKTLESIPEVKAIVESELAEDKDVYVDLDAVQVQSDTTNVKISSDEEIKAELEDGSKFLMLIPGNSTGYVEEDGTMVYQDTLQDTDIVVQPQQEAGIRITAVINSDNAPTSFDFSTTFEDAEIKIAEDGSANELNEEAEIKIAEGGSTNEVNEEAEIKIAENGSAAVVNKDNLIISTFEAPWAYDASSNPIKTWYTTDGTTLTLNVDHTSTDNYPVIADPKLDWGNISGTAYFNKLETETITFVGATSLSALIAVPPPFNVVVASYAFNILGWAGTAIALDKCLKLKFGFTFSFSGPPSPGISPGHHTGGNCY